MAMAASRRRVSSPLRDRRTPSAILARVSGDFFRPRSDALILAFRSGAKFFRGFVRVVARRGLRRSLASRPGRP
jgi:hypothetical protein